MTDEKNITYGYHHLEAGHPDNQKNYRICGSRTRQAESKPVCHRPAGWGTSHPGVGRCKLHGGCSPTGPDHPNWRGGRYAYQFRGRLRQHYNDLDQHDGNPLDLLPELEVQRIILLMALQSLNEKMMINENTDDVTLLDKDLGLGMVGDGGGGTSTAKGYLADIPCAEFLSIEDIRFLSECVNDVVSTVTKIHASHNKNALSKTEVNYLLAKIKQGMDLFVPKENREAFVRWLQSEIPGTEQSETLKGTVPTTTST